jgi:plasmid stabilization system protein ParE
MSYSYRLHPQARIDLAEAYAWYENESSGLGERFVKIVQQKIDEVVSNPQWYGSKKKGFRETIISTDFPHLVVYKISHSKKEILISSIFHSSRNPKDKYRK